MFSITYATAQDKSYWYSLERHMPESEYELKARDKRCSIIRVGGRPAGILQYNLFWDNTPFLTLIYLEEPYRGKGFGAKAVSRWEEEMRSLGYQMVMTSTQADEEAQHFYRKLGYRDVGCLVMHMPPFEQPLEIFLAKVF